MNRLSFAAIAGAVVVLASPVFAQTTPAAPPATPPAATAAASAYTDAQVRSFVAASAVIDPLSADLSSTDAAKRTAAVTRARAALQTNNIDQATYNGIATAARTDTALAARINALRAPTATPAPAATPPASTTPATPQHH